MIPTRQLFLGLLVSVFLIGCKSSEPAAPLFVLDAPTGFTAISDSLAPDPEIEALIAPFRQGMIERTSEVIGTAEVQLQKGGLESTLGNMSADAMLLVANKMVNTPIDMSLTNNGGLRVPIAKGPITVGKIFELMPFENMMVILTMSATQVDSLSQQLARRRGEPIAGFSFKINEATNRAVDIMVDGMPLDQSRTYRLVTSDYLANGGGRLPALWQPVGREDLNMLLRDTFIEYIREKGTINPKPDGRIMVIGQ